MQVENEYPTITLIIQTSENEDFYSTPLSSLIIFGPSSFDHSASLSKIANAHAYVHPTCHVLPVEILDLSHLRPVRKGVMRSFALKIYRL